MTDATASSADRWDLAAALGAVGEAVRAAVGLPRGAADAVVVRTEGGDDVFGVDARADEVLVAEVARRCGERWPGTLVLEGFDAPVAVGDAGGPWRYLADPVDGSRPWLWGKRPAWCLLGAGLEAATLAGLEVGAAVELPVGATAEPVTAVAVRGAGVRSTHPLRPQADATLEHRFVTVMRYLPGTKAALGAWEDDVLGGLHSYEDTYLSTGGLLMEIGAGRQAAALDPRPLVAPEAMASHPYDLAAWVVAAEAGVVVEALPPGPLDAPLDTSTPVAWAGYANEEVAAELRLRVRRRHPTTPGSAPPGTG